ncbi:MAG: dTMP kinase [Myxococcota bacterium]
MPPLRRFNNVPGGMGFIVLEGIDGAGKSVQAQRLARWLRERGRSVVETREPTDGEWGRRYRAWARGALQASPEQVLDIFVEDRREHVANVIRPALTAGQLVVCDRYQASTLAYQTAQGLPEPLVRRRLAAEGSPEPDLTLWLRLPVDQALSRIVGAAGERFERAAFLEAVDREYARMDLAAIDAAQPPDTVEQAIRAHVLPLLEPA